MIGERNHKIEFTDMQKASLGSEMDVWDASPRFKRIRLRQRRVQVLVWATQWKPRRRKKNPSTRNLQAGTTLRFRKLASLGSQKYWFRYGHPQKSVAWSMKAKMGQSRKPQGRRVEISGQDDANHPQWPSEKLCKRVKEVFLSLPLEWSAWHKNTPVCLYPTQKSSLQNW